MKWMATLLLCVPPSASALISPAWSAYSNFKAALNGDSCYTIQEPALVDNVQKIIIQACTDQKAAAWEAIVSPAFRKDFGYVEFHGPSGPVKATSLTGASLQDKTASLAAIFSLALGENPNLNSVMRFDLSACPYCQANVVLEMKPRVIQVFMDDINDAWGQHNKTAQDHFACLINSQYDQLKVMTTTTKKP